MDENNGSGNPSADTITIESDSAINPTHSVNGIVSTNHEAIDPASVIKRGRGRPPKSDIGSDTGGDTGSRKNKARNESGNSAKPQISKAVELKQLANQLQAGHAMLALLTKNPLWSITEDESVRLANAIKAVLVFHNMAVNPKVAAYGELAIACTMIYGSRLGMMVMQKKAQQKQEAKIMQMPQANVTPSNFNPNPSGKMRFE